MTHRFHAAARLLAFALALVGCLTLILACAGCGESSTESSVEAGPTAEMSEMVQPGSYAVATRDFTFVDASRPTPPNGTEPGKPDRTLTSRVWFPADAAGAPEPGPFPIVGYAHGLTSSVDEAQDLKQHLASHGYVVVAASFPVSSGGAPGGPSLVDLASQPGDLAFLVDSVVALDGADASLAAAVDPDRLGIVGLSLGGLTVLIGAYHPVLDLPGAKVAVAHAPPLCFFGSALYEHALPTLIIGGDADLLVPYDTSAGRALELAPPPLTTVRLEGATHMGFLGFELLPDGKNPDTPMCPALEAILGTRPDLRTAGTLVEDLNRGITGDVYDPAPGCDTVCGRSFVQTMTAVRQLELSRAATLAQLESVLRDRDDAARFLETAFDRDNDDVGVTLSR